MTVLVNLDFNLGFIVMSHTTGRSFIVDISFDKKLILLCPFPTIVLALLLLGCSSRMFSTD